MNNITCFAEITENGYLQLPDKIIKRLHKINQSRFKIIIIEKSPKNSNLNSLCGKWSGDDAEDLINQIKLSRQLNNRSELFDF